jgi:hypothetical protein
MLLTAGADAHAASSSGAVCSQVVVIVVSTLAVHSWQMRILGYNR